MNDNYVPDNGAGTVTSTDVSGEVYGIDALALSGGAGDVTVNLGANATLSTSTGSDGLFGIYALSEDTGNVSSVNDGRRSDHLWQLWCPGGQSGRRQFLGQQHHGDGDGYD